METRVMTKSRFDFLPTSLSGLTVVQRKPIEDDRGFFCRFYCAEELREAGLRKPVAQMNHTFTLKKGTVRGLHFQYPPYAETKLISCLKGEVFDVAVDIRRGSPTFLCWHGENLSAVNKKSLLIPEGFAHGFQSLTDTCEILYLVTAHYNPRSEDVLNVQDPLIGIRWPLDITGLSARDKAVAHIPQAYQGIDVPYAAI
jgi:dTDP-4-dehydrorhamnose 3,5-epimerase